MDSLSRSRGNHQHFVGSHNLHPKWDNISWGNKDIESSPSLSPAPEPKLNDNDNGKTSTITVSLHNKNDDNGKKKVTSSVIKEPNNGGILASDNINNIDDLNENVNDDHNKLKSQYQETRKRNSSFRRSQHEIIFTPYQVVLLCLLYCTDCEHFRAQAGHRTIVHS